ncbi:MAG: class I SAM-dependent methyltransferase, partial [Cyclobacteriaceae bacterium]
MGKFRIEKLKSYLSKSFSDVQTVVETGTFKGESTEIMANHFKRVITIELDDVMYNETSSKLLNKGYKNIEFKKGDSGEIIQNLVEELKEPTVFFLDAHWSGDNSVNWEKGEWKGYGINTAHLGKTIRPSGHEQVPMDREIRAIAERFTNKGAVYIDDLVNFDFWGKGLKNRNFEGEDYSHLDLRDIRKVFGNRLIDWVNLEVQLIIKFDRSE